MEKFKNFLESQEKEFLVHYSGNTEGSLTIKAKSKEDAEKKFNKEKKTLFKPGTKIEFDWADLNEEFDGVYKGRWRGIVGAVKKYADMFNASVINTGGSKHRYEMMFRDSDKAKTVADEMKKFGYDVEFLDSKTIEVSQKF